LVADKPVTLAAIAGAHGVAGEVRLKLFGEGLATFKPHDDGKGGAIARFAEIPDRTAAEKLRGTVLTVPRSALPPLGEGEYYHADLLGLAAVSDAGEALGEVIAVEDFGAGDVIEILRPDGRKFMVPMRIEAVPRWSDTQLVVNADFAED
jgi:16S rRNA processing protein RimM